MFPVLPHVLSSLYYLLDGFTKSEYAVDFLTNIFFIYLKWSYIISQELCGCTIMTDWATVLGAKTAESTNSAFCWQLTELNPFQEWVCRFLIFRKRQFLDHWGWGFIKIYEYINSLKHSPSKHVLSIFVDIAGAFDNLACLGQLAFKHSTIINALPRCTAL